MDQECSPFTAAFGSVHRTFKWTIWRRILPVWGFHTPCSISGYVDRAAIGGFCIVMSQNITPQRIIGKVAEGMGFEPTIGFKPYDGLANRCLQPLGHPSSQCGVPVGRRWRGEGSSGAAMPLSTLTEMEIRFSRK